MSHAPLKALEYILAAMPELASGQVFFTNGRLLDADMPFESITYQQAFYPYAAELRAHDAVTVQDFPTGEALYDTVLMLAPQNKLAARYLMAQSLMLLKPEGLLVVCAANDAGGKRMGPMLRSLGLDYSEEPKNKCRIVWARKKTINADVIQSWLTAGSMQPVLEGEFVSQPGIFGWNKIDAGSRLLAHYIPDNLCGAGADFGCGYGYLSQKMLQKNRSIEKLFCVDADHKALQCCRQNLDGHDTPITYLWDDLTDFQGELPPLDWIIMNPPFHEGKYAEHDIGKVFIKTAAQRLKSRGMLYMVANSQLPYEEVMRVHFRKIEKCAEENGFKVYQLLK